MHHVTRFDPTDLDVPAVYEDASSGFRRVSHIDRTVGAVHTGFGTCELAQGGSIDAHVHSYEELVYVVEGNPVLTLDGRAYTLGAEECAFIGVGATHSWENAGDGVARWIDLQSPQARPASEPADTFFVPAPGAPAAVPLDVRDPRTRNFAR